MGASDARVVGWLASQYTGEGSVEAVRPWRTLARLGEQIAYQISDTHYVLVSGNPEQPFQVLENGERGVLFEQGGVAPLDTKLMAATLQIMVDVRPDMWWLEVLKHYNVTSDMAAGDSEKLRKLIALLYYISPWLLRWRGTQLPIELVLGEAGSGKSSLYELRQSIINGRTSLVNMQHSLKDWYASIAGASGIHVIDNVHFAAGAGDLSLIHI